MTPAARIQTAIELLDSLAGDDRPADLAARRFLRARRYIGSKDRRAINDLVFATVRGAIRFDWRIQQAGGVPTSRTRVLAALSRCQSAPQIVDLFDSSRYGPAGLSPGEQRLLARLTQNAPAAEAAPVHVLGNFPAWLEPDLRDQFGADLDIEMAAFDRAAPVDLRVNLARGTRDAALAALRSFGLDADPTPLSPAGIRLHGRPRLTDHPVLRDGLATPQDEGAQLAAWLVAPGPEAPRVLDFCAGAGGKTLALADIMASISPASRRLVACDVESKRLARLGPRADRAAIDWIETHALSAGDDLWSADNAAVFDRVLVDAPCSGTGTWRRQPDARQRLTPARLDRYRRQQAEILRHAGRLVAPGGRLVYVTCSVLPSENRDQIARVLDERKDFSMLPVGAVWEAVLGTACPTDQTTLQLTPRRHGVDGFYIAILRRHPGPDGS